MYYYEIPYNCAKKWLFKTNKEINEISPLNNPWKVDMPSNKASQTKPIMNNNNNSIKI